MLRPSGQPCHKLPEQMETKALQVPLKTMHLHRYLKSYLVYIVLRKISLILHCILLSNNINHKGNILERVRLDSTSTTPVHHSHNPTCSA